MFRESSHNAIAFGVNYKFFCFIFIMLGLFYFPASASAHKVTIFAWVDGDTVHTQSKFSGGKRVKNAPILVYDSKDVLLLDGKTDKTGMFSFKIPQKTSLKIVLKASMAHMAVWKIPVEDLGGTEPENAPKTETLQDSLKTSSDSVDSRAHEQVSASSTVALGKQEIEAIIDASLDKKLAPITDMLADSIHRGPGITEIMGGLGYILGLVGVALYFANRKRKN
jgi:nickel transport protein